VLVRLGFVGGVADSLSVLVRFVVGLVEFLSLVCIVLGDVPRHFVLCEELIS
jgi:hypothetical protein